MSLNETPSANRVHIAFFGRRNAGKSSLVNAVTGQNLAIVSEVKGTTTDPVYKAMELLPLGPVVIIDTPGFDDEGELGGQRVQRARQVLNKTNAAVLVLDGELPQGSALLAEQELIDTFNARSIPFLIVKNKSDLCGDGGLSEPGKNEVSPLGEVLPVSAKTGLNISQLKEKIASIAQVDTGDKRLVADLIKPLDLIVLVIPIDKAAPKGRLILPQQQVIRDILEAGASAVVVREVELEKIFAFLDKKIALVITDSQAFALVSSVTPKDIPLTSFSILFARYKGFLETAVRGAAALDDLQNGDKLLICEGCTHHRQCDDIGTVKLPHWITEHCKKEIEFNYCCGGDFPQDLSPYKLVIHCGGCMLNDREMLYRRSHAEMQKIPFTNYGIAIAHIHGILERSIAMLKTK